MMEMSPTARMVHEPHGFVDLVSCDADDLSVVNAARVSYGKRSDWEYDQGEALLLHMPISRTKKKLKTEDEHVLRYMMRNQHGTPFEHNKFTFHVRAPIFVFREWHRHRIGISINEESARYVPLKPDFYLPDDEHCREQVGKPGAYTYEPMNPTAAFGLRIQMKNQYNTAFDVYEFMMREGVAKELARAVLPVGIYSQMYWTCNARSLMAFLALRNAPTAQREIKDYAEVMEQIFVEKMPVTAQAFIDSGRIAP